MDGIPSFPHSLWHPPRIRLAGWFDSPRAGESVCYNLQLFAALHYYEYSGQVSVGSREFEFNEGDITVAPLGLPLSYDIAQPGKHLCVHFHPHPAGGDATAEIPVFIHAGRVSGHLRERLCRVIVHCVSARHDDVVAAAAASAAFQEVLLELSLNAYKPESPAPSRPSEQALIEAALWIEEHLTDEITIAQVCRHVGLSQNYLARLFRKRYGVTMPGYILRRRIETARELLATTNLSIKEVARNAGIPDAQYFNKQFRRFTGMSPSALRRQVAEGEYFQEPR